MINNKLSKKIVVYRKRVLDKKEIVNKFNNIFVKIGQKLAEKTQPSKYLFVGYIDSILPVTNYLHKRTKTKSPGVVLVN